jgi:tRNA-uridine 2-sulfurtransferase
VSLWQGKSAAGKRYFQMRRIAVAISGGVDSAVAALLIKQQGFDAVGVTMSFRLSHPNGSDDAITGLHAVEDAAKICERLNIEHQVIDVSAEMEKEVIQPFISEYLMGRTPNPCIACNRRLKFGLLFEKALSLGIDGFATGHYADVAAHGNSYYLKRPKDRLKDQTYFLYTLPKDMLPRLIFPLAGYTKEEVRALAVKEGIAVSAARESQDICFMPKGGCGEFLTSRGITVRRGDIVDMQGKIVGEHKGIVCYTVGQRGGLGISAPQPFYVVRIDAQNNRLIVGEKIDLKAKGLIADRLNWFFDDPPVVAWAKIRYGHRAERCSIERGDKDSIAVRFDKPQEAISCGQSVVFYDDQTVLGGGVIKEVSCEDC